MIWYISRDSHEGVLSERCDVWKTKPIRTHVNNRVVWVCPKEDEDAHEGSHTTAVVTKRAGTYPETDRELIVADQGELKPVSK